MQVICVAGVRPNYVKIKPVMDALEEAGAQVTLVHTRQHYDRAMNDVFFAELGIRRPDHFLGAGSGTHAMQTCRVMTAADRALWLWILTWTARMLHRRERAREAA